MILVYWVIISRNLMMIRLFIRRSKLMMYTFIRQRNIISTFLQFMEGLLTTSNLTFYAINILLQ